MPSTEEAKRRKEVIKVGTGIHTRKFMACDTVKSGAVMKAGAKVKQGGRDWLYKKSVKPNKPDTSDKNWNWKRRKGAQMGR